MNTVYSDVTSAIYPEGLTRNNIKEPSAKNTSSAKYTIMTFLDVILLTVSTIGTCRSDIQSTGSPNLTQLSDKTCLDNLDRDVILTFTVANLLPLLLRDDLGEQSCALI